MSRIQPPKTCTCGKEMSYNYHYECYECSCGKVFNAAGQELAPIGQWKQEWEEDDY